MSQLDHAGGDRVLSGETGKGRIQGEQLIIHDLGLGRDVGQLDPTAAAAGTGFARRILWWSTCNVMMMWMLTALTVVSGF